MAKKLFVLISDGGDGSYYPKYTFNKEWVDEQAERYLKDGYEEYAIGVDGDGFHYDTLMVPDECTLESLGIRYDCALED